MLLARIGPDGWREILAGGNPLDAGGMVLLALCVVLLLPAVLIRPRRGESDRAAESPDAAQADDDPAE